MRRRSAAAGIVRLVRGALNAMRDRRGRVPLGTLSLRVCMAHEQDTADGPYDPWSWSVQTAPSRTALAHRTRSDGRSGRPAVFRSRRACRFRPVTTPEYLLGICGTPLVSYGDNARPASSRSSHAGPNSGWCSPLENGERSSGGPVPRHGRPFVPTPCPHRQPAKGVRRTARCRYGLRSSWHGLQCAGIAKITAPVLPPDARKRP
jgi:hypothetical protein